LQGKSVSGQLCHIKAKNMETKALWNRVKKLIKAHKMTQKQFAKCINIPSGSFEGLIYHDREPIL